MTGVVTLFLRFFVLFLRKGGNIVHKYNATMSVKCAAEYLGIGLSKMYELVHSPNFTAALRIGRRIVISTEALETWVKDNAQKPIV